MRTSGKIFNLNIFENEQACYFHCIDDRISSLCFCVVVIGTIFPYLCGIKGCFRSSSWDHI